MTPRYASGLDVRRSLETRLAAEAARTLRPIDRLRQSVVFDRLIARMHKSFGERAILEGGVAMELRLDIARTTRDLDASITGSPRRIGEELLDAAQADLDDHFRFTLARDRRRPTIEGDSVRYGGARFRGEARLAGKIYGAPFGVDVVYGHSIVGAPDLLSTRGYLEFLGVAPTSVLVVNRETHLAEKLHAFTLPRPSANSRVKDLPDIALLAQSGPMESGPLEEAFAEVFARRATHPLPDALPSPPPSWEGPYARMASMNRLPWMNLAEVTRAAAAFVDPLLAGVRGIWYPSAWCWVTV